MHRTAAHFDTQFITSPESPDRSSADRLSRGGRRVSVLCPMSTIPPPSPVASQRFRDHQWLVEAETRRAIRRRVPHEFDDLKQAGLLGLMQADRRAAPDMPAPDFCRYACAVVRGAMIDELRRVAHGGRNKGADPKKPRKLAPGMLAMAQSAGLVPRSVIDRHDVQLISSDPSPEEELLTKEQAEWLQAALGSLPARPRDMVSRRLQGERVDVLAAEYGISQARTSQVVSEAVAVLRVWPR